MTPASGPVAIIGAGIAGIATAYCLSRRFGMRGILLIDRGQPMAFTSAQSGENYRNWWPHPAMVALTDRSIDLMEQIARDSANRIAMTRRGYALATRAAEPDDLIARLHDSLGARAATLLRHHRGASGRSYPAFDDPDWTRAPDGVDIVQNPALIHARFPGYAADIRTVIHIRRGGDINGQQLGMYMLEHLRQAGARRVLGEVRGICRQGGFRIELATASGTATVTAERIVNAAGPFAGEIARMLGVALPIRNVFQQKIAFEDRAGAVPRGLPFSIDLDGQRLDWSEEERATLLAEPELAWLARDMPGGIHCRPDGGQGGKWVRLGWACNRTPAPASWAQPLDPVFPDIVLRAAARLQPALRRYVGRLPRARHHYGGWYTMTEENWPLIGAMGPEGAFMTCALSGFGTMAACAAGELCAATIAGAELPEYAAGFSLRRRSDPGLMAALRAAGKGVL